MHWEHARSKDLIEWEHMDVALAPSEFYDDDNAGGCFSGTSIVENDMLYVFYTGTVFRNGKTIQTQNMVYSSDGIKFTKYSLEMDYEGGSTENFRDPKVWKENGTYYMLVGTSLNKRKCSFI
ncbi:glycoside hydrolase family 32 protein [Bacillus cabrialesii subsp. cabrialesii]|uniref:glycoside hydrolase family 32 protein n=1 Tax=Bacillus cabrialesii TaxID=2487276 RepID=UPI0033065F1E